VKPIIRVENVSKRYDLGLTRTSLPTVISQWVRRFLDHTSDKLPEDQHLWALKDVSFELQKGQSLALIGPNGAGKSTILKLLSKITVPTSGSIKVNGQLSALIELGAGFHPDLTGRENIYLNGTILGLKRGEIERRFDEIVAFSELERFIDTPVKRYSSGMAVRLGFAVASCIEPDILLVDEVLAVGDASFRQKCIERIKELLDHDTSLIFVSHSMELVKAVCDTAIYIEDGEVQQYGNSSEVIDVYNQVLDRRRALKLSQSHASSARVGPDIEITKIEVSAVDGQPTGELYSDQVTEVRVHYLAYRSLGEAHMLVRIYRADGVSCCIMRSSLDNVQMSFEQGAGVVSLTLGPLQLYGGMYYAIAWIMDREDIDGITRGSSDWFQVKNRVPGREAQDAVFEPNRQWHHHRLPHDNTNDNSIAKRPIRISQPTQSPEVPK
jgi:lipopolysaccharide transport system ATP-binding protein